VIESDDEDSQGTLDGSSDNPKSIPKSSTKDRKNKGASVDTRMVIVLD
jgi:hypothetical protein